MRRWSVALAALLITSCSLEPANSEENFHRWIEADAARTASYERFEALLTREGVSGVVPAYELWLTDRLRRQCVTGPFMPPPEEAWDNIVPALRFIRDHVVPAIGDVRVVSSYRDEAFNACVQGAAQSAHRVFYALDLVPVNRGVSRRQLIETLCPIHAREGMRAGIGLGIYAGQRFHIDARGFRGWGADYHRATFPCDRPNNPDQ
jgi:hypothetical protein